MYLSVCLSVYLLVCIHLESERESLSPPPAQERESFINSDCFRRADLSHLWFFDEAKNIMPLCLQ